MLKAILRAVAAVEAIKGASNGVMNAGRRAQLHLLNAATLLVKDSLPKSNRKPKLTLTESEGDLARKDDGKIPAIKAYRTRTGAGLKEAKDAVEDWMEANLGYRYYPVAKPTTLYIYRDGLLWGCQELNEHQEVDTTSKNTSWYDLPYEVRLAISHWLNKRTDVSKYGSYSWSYTRGIP